MSGTGSMHFGALQLEVVVLMMAGPLLLFGHMVEADRTVPLQVRLGHQRLYEDMVKHTG